jgi:hypothetical protein
MKTPPPREAQLEFAERPVAGILQHVLRVDSNARLGLRNELHADLLALDGVARPERRNAPRRWRSHSHGHHQKQTRMNSNPQNALIVSGKTSQQKSRVTPSACGPEIHVVRMRTFGERCARIRCRERRPRSNVSNGNINGICARAFKRLERKNQWDLRPRVRTKPVLA